MLTQPLLHRVQLHALIVLPNNNIKSCNSASFGRLTLGISRAVLWRRLHAVG